MRQSPIDINTASITRAQIPLSITSNSGGAGVPDPLIVSGKLNNNGRAIGFTINSEKTPVKLKFKGVAFTLKQFHFHFGCEGDMGSEHAIDGKRFPGEVFSRLLNFSFSCFFVSMHIRIPETDVTNEYKVLTCIVSK